MALGKLDRLKELSKQPYFLIDDNDRQVNQPFSSEAGLAELRINPKSSLIGQTIVAIGMRRHTHFNVLAIQGNGRMHRTNLQQIPLASGDALLLQGDKAALTAARPAPDFGGGLNVFVEEPDTAVDLGLSPYTLMMVIAIAALASFMSPVGHPANVLVLGPGGYRFMDYVKVGMSLTLVVMIVTLLLLPLVWPP